MLIQSACQFGRESGSEKIGGKVLELVDGAIRFGALPRDVMTDVVETLAFTASVGSLFEGTWHCMRNLLGSHRSQLIFSILCSFFDVHEGLPKSRIPIVCGAMELVSGACWDMPVPTVAFSDLYVLSYLQHLSGVEVEVIEYGILRCLNSMVVAHRNDLSTIEWDLFLEIVGTLTRCWVRKDVLVTDKGWKLGGTLTSVQNPTMTMSVLKLHNTTLLELERIYCHDTHYSASTFYDHLVPVIPILSEPFALALLDNYASRINQCDGWADLLKQLLVSSFYTETRTSIRARALELVNESWLSAQAGEKEGLLEHVILPLLRHLPEEGSSNIVTGTLNFVRLVMEGMEGEDFHAVLTLLLAATGGRHAQSQDANKRHEVTRIAHRCVRLLLELFASTAVSRPDRGCLDIFKHVISLSTSAFVDPSIRSLSVAFLLGLRADNRGRLVLPQLGNLLVEHDQEEETAAHGLVAGRGAGEMGQGNATPMRSCPKVGVGSGGDYAASIGVKVTEGEREMVEVSTLADASENDGMMILPIGDYVDGLILILSSEKNWSLYSAVLKELPSQLQNVTLFRGIKGQIGKLRVVVCDTIQNEKAAATVIDMPPQIRKTEVYLLAFKVLTSLLGHRSHFSRQQQDEILQTFQIGLNRWPNVAKHCMHALTLALSEMPSNMAKLLPSTLLKVSQTMSATSGVHNLEFLAALAPKKDLCVNFTEADFKRIFGVALQFIHSPPTISSNASPAVSATSQYIVSLAYEVLLTWFVSLRIAERRKCVPFILHYLLLTGDSVKGKELDENVELVLDLLVQNTYADCLPKPPDRPTQSNLSNSIDKPSSRTWIQGNALVTIRLTEQEGWCEMTIKRPTGVVSFWTRLENRLKLDNSSFVPLPAPLEKDVEPLRRMGSLGSSRSQGRRGSDGTTTAIRPIRRPSFKEVPKMKTARSASISSLGEHNQLPASSLDDEDYQPMATSSTLPRPPHRYNPTEHVDQPLPLRRGRSLSLHGSSKVLPDLQPLDPSSTLPPLSPFKRDDQIALDPSFIMLQLLSYPNTASTSNPKPLPTDDATTRAISVLDRTPIVDLHKIGVVYAGQGQSTEAEMLANCAGSSFYGAFLRSIGRLVRLKDCKEVYTGGLDTSEDFDGKYAIYNQNHLVQTIFHCPTLMPTLDHDPHCTGKKRHIGNDFVTVIWNESGLPFRFDTIPSQFNFVNIIIEPAGSISKSALDDYENHLFTVSAQFRDGMPEVGALGDPKLISGESLGAFITGTAVHCNMFSQIFWQCISGNTHVNNAKERLRQIKRMKERAISGGSNQLDFSSFT
ncbi:Tuberous sclerosis 2-like protein [Rhizophlyctis rosea]|nr:Tuberous sclerosis 2-like protein [Rhizophlyctis rosea]